VPQSHSPMGLTNEDIQLLVDGEYSPSRLDPVMVEVHAENVLIQDTTRPCPDMRTK